MIKKCGILTLAIILILALLLPFKNVYAIDSFFEVNKKEVSKDESVELVINLDKIVYEEFVFELVSDTQLSGVSTNDDIQVERNDNEIYIKIDKNTTNLNKLVLNYQIPEDKVEGDTIIFVANVKNFDDETQTQVEQVEITIIENEDKEDVIQSDNTEEQKPNQVENIQNQKPNEQDNKVIANAMNNLNNKETNAEQMTKTTNIQGTSNKQQSSTVETVIYNGSNNNYLSNLAIEGFELNKTFYKENTTYFLEVDSNISSVNIITEKEDDTATVCIYGNNELKIGTNKILVNVTAENGNVRTYRIYVTVNA